MVQRHRPARVRAIDFVLDPRMQTLRNKHANIQASGLGLASRGSGNKPRARVRAGARVRVQTN